MADDAALLRRAGVQRGLVTLDQLGALGFSSDELRNRLQRGVLEKVHPRVFRVAGHDSTWRQHLLAGCLGAGPLAGACRRSASGLWQLDGASCVRLEVVTVRWKRRCLDGCRVVESTDLRPSDIHMMERIPVTSVRRTLIDVGAVVPGDVLRGMADDAVRRRMTTYEAILERFVQVARRGRPGVAAMRALLEERLGVMLDGSNCFEQMVLELVRDAGLPPPVAQHPVTISGHRYFLDLAWPERKVVVECDGWETHGTPVALQADLERQNHLVLDGWTVLRFAWRTVKDDPSRVVAQCRAALAA